MTKLPLELRRWLVTFLCAGALSMLWNLASPPGSAADEHAHVVKAAAAVRGELVGRSDPEVGAASRIVRAPAIFGRLKDVSGCYAFQPTVPASCSPSFTGPTHLVELQSRAGLSPPAFHLLTGLPLRLEPSSAGLYASRTIAAAVNAALVASALTLAVRRGATRFGVIGILVGWTATCLYFSSVLNPSGLELSAALLVWVALLALVAPEDADEPIDGALPWMVAAGASLLLLARQLGPLWLALIVLALSPLPSFPRIRSLLRSPSARWAAVPVALASIIAVSWLAVYEPLASKAGSDSFDVSLGRAIAITFGRLGDVYTGAIGRFGWLDTPVPRAVEWLWTGLLFALVSLAWALAGVRQRIALVLTASIAIAAPPLIEASQLDTAGLVWQSRYTLPLAVGLPVLAGHVIDRRADIAPLLRSWATTCLVCVGVAHLAAFYVALRRYSVGTNGPVWFLGNDGWDPPVPAWLLLTAFAGTLGMTGWWLSAMCRSGSGAPNRDRVVVPVRRDSGLSDDLV